MQPLVTAEGMQACDRAAIERYRVPGLVLMENAGRSFVGELCARRPVAGERILVACGRGNNGGDGFVIARHLANFGAAVDVLLVGRPADLRGDAAIQFAAVRQMSRGTHPALTLRMASTERAFLALPTPGIVVDALLGTGFSGSPRGAIERAIRWINASKAFVASVDIPSGVHASTGEVPGAAVNAHLTVTLAALKIGLVAGRGRELAGEVVVGDIGMPRAILELARHAALRVTGDDVAEALPVRPLRAHKYAVGKVFVLAGSRAFTGAAVLCAEAALRSGAGAVVLGFPESQRAIFARKLTEVLLEPLPETPEGTIAPAAREAVARRLQWADAAAIGPGLGRNSATDEFVRAIVAASPVPTVLDADGLTAFAGRTSALRTAAAPLIVTPHTGELARLVGGSADDIEAHRVLRAAEAARKLKAIVVLKGAPTVTASPGAQPVVNSTGNPGMATIGSGDVLTGVIAGLLAQGMQPQAAAWAGVFLHGRAGDIAAGILGERSLLASDILERLPAAFHTLRGR